jgi:uncharacterized protein (TIGR03435 family)
MNRQAISFFVFAAAMTVASAAQTPSSPGPAFEVVSVKHNTTESGDSSISQRPDGGLRMVNVSVRTILGRGYPGSTMDIIGLPDWASSERYDVAASPVPGRPNPSQDERRDMVRAMLADRFKLSAHYETREQPAFNLGLARADGKLGPGLKPSEVDCAALAASRRAEAEAVRVAGQPPPSPVAVGRTGGAVPPCAFNFGFDRFEGDTTLAALAPLLRSMAGRPVVDKTGLTGSYRVDFQFSRASLEPAGPDAPAPGDAPSIFTAVQEQLGLKLESTRISVEVLVIDRIDRPTEN